MAVNFQLCLTLQPCLAFSRKQKSPPESGGSEVQVRERHPKRRLQRTHTMARNPQRGTETPTPASSCSPLRARWRVTVALLLLQSSRERGKPRWPLPWGCPRGRPAPVPLPQVPPSPSPQGLSGCRSSGYCEHGGVAGAGGALHSGKKTRNISKGLGCSGASCHPLPSLQPWAGPTRRSCHPPPFP